MRLFQFILIASFITLINCRLNPEPERKDALYNFSSPEHSIYLPAVLHEISGIVLADTNLLACVQDENGIVFFYDLNKRSITDKIFFASNGDYEDIALANDTLFVLQSDGLLIKIADFRSGKAVVTSYQTGVPVKDNEALCYDRQNNRLLIALKESTGKGDFSKSKRYVFSLSLSNGLFDPDPVYSFDVKEIIEFALENKIELPLSGKNKENREPELKFRASAIGIHPLNGEIYIISSEDSLLFVFNAEGKVKKIIKLNRGLFNQPEGLTFKDNGDMIISNEGIKKGPASLRILLYHRAEK